MSAAAIFLFLAVLLLAYSNGANDNFKGVATLYGSGTADYRTALMVGTGATFLGSAAALWFGTGLIRSFSGKGLVPDAVAADPVFLAAVGFGAAATVFLATRFGFPVSTTHALVGALVGAGIVKAGSAVSVTQLGAIFFAPLIFSPLMASVLATVKYPLFRWVKRVAGVPPDACLCVGEDLVAMPMTGGAARLARVTTATMDTTSVCVERYGESLSGVSAGAVLDALHYASAGAVSFARGVNDTPKIAALLLAMHLLAPQQGLVLAGLAIAIGGLLSARRVAETMSRRITSMDPVQAFSANLTTALLVLFASRVGLPVSTTHVSCGALVGIGAVTRQAHWKTIGQIFLAWITTLPVAAVLAGALALVL